MSWGYGGEWLDAHSVESFFGGWVVFLADRASGSIYAHRSGLLDGKGIDAFPGYDPQNNAPGVVWPDSTTASLTQYWPGRNRIPNCRSVSSMPWPWKALPPPRTFDLGDTKIAPVGGTDDKRRPGTFPTKTGPDDPHPARPGSIGPQPPGPPPGFVRTREAVPAALVAAVGPSDPVASVFLCPFEWLDAPSGTSGEFLYSDPTYGPFETRFPLLEAGESPEGVVSALTVRAMVWPPSAFAKESEELFVVGLGGTFDTRWDLAVIEPKSVTLSTRPALRDPADMVVHWWRMPRDPTGGFGPDQELKPLHDRGVQELHVLDVRDAGSRLYVLMEDTRDDEEGGWWLVTLGKDVYATSPSFDVLYVQELDTTHRKQEIQRLKVSPDHRWLAVTFGAADVGVMVLHVPEEHGKLGQPEVVAGLRRVRVNNVVRWEGWDRVASPPGFGDLEATYDWTERGQGGVPLIPVWPVPESSLAEEDIQPSAQVDLEATSAEFLETASGMLLSFDTDPISIWRLVPEDAATTDCPLRFIGCLASEQSQRMRVAWRTPHGVSHLGDRGSWTWATCQSDTGTPCPVQPDPIGA